MILEFLSGMVLLLCLFGYLFRVLTFQRDSGSENGCSFRFDYLITELLDDYECSLHFRCNYYTIAIINTVRRINFSVM